MALFLLRDDDANATTDPARLARAYAPLLDAGCALTLSVIPKVRLDTLDPHGNPERFLPPDRAVSSDTVELTADHPLAAWLRDHRSSCDVAQHGLDHQRVRARSEFGALSLGEARVRIQLGHDILSRALGAPPLAFVAPWDALSRGSLLAALERFPLVSTGWLDRERLPPSWWLAHLVERLHQRESLRLGDSRVLRHRGGLLGPHTSPEDVPRLLDHLARHAHVAVVLLHHWMFWEQPEPHPVIRALARALRPHRTARLAELLPSRSGPDPVSSRDLREVMS